MKKTLQQRMDWLYKNQPHNIEAINALLRQLPAPVKAPRSPVVALQSPLPQVDFKGTFRNTTPTNKSSEIVPEPWPLQPAVQSAFKSFCQSFTPKSNPFALYRDGCPLSEFMGFCLFLKTVHLS